MAADDPLSPADLPTSVTSCESLREWLVRDGAADLGSSHLRLHLEGSRSETVTVSGLRARIVARSAPYKATKVRCPSAGAQDAQRVFIDLDQRDAAAQEVDEDGNPVGPYFATKTVTLTRGEPLDFVIEAHTEHSAVRWQLELELQVGAKRSTFLVDLPIFETTAVSDQGYDAAWDWRWDHMPQRLEAST